MSDTMLLGVLRLPIRCWDESELGQLQRYSRYLEAADRIESDQAKLEILDQFEEEGAFTVLKTYLKLHEGKIGAHWLWCALERIAQGEKEFDVLWDYGYSYNTVIIKMKENVDV